MDSNGPTNLVNLPHEIHLSIAKYLALHPRDLFSVLKTCTSLHSTFSSKSIWDTALETICIRDALFKPTYPVASMSVSQLQRATMAPELWNTRLRLGKPFTGASVKKLSSVRKTARISDYMHNRVFFVPGGRYLLEQVKGSISLWDLGLPSLLRDRNTLWQESRIVDTVDTAGDSSIWRTRHEIIVNPSPDGEALRVWVLQSTSGRTNGSLRYVLEIYEIRPLDTSPKFQQLSRLDILLPAWSFRWDTISTRENQIICRSVDGFLVWDYVRRRYTVWDFMEYSDSQQDLLFLSHASIYLVTSTILFVWDVPEAKDVVPKDKPIELLAWSDAPPFPAPKHTVHYNSRGEYRHPVDRTLSHWYSSLDSFPPLFDLQVYNNIDGMRLVRFRFDDTDPNPQPQRIVAFPEFPRPEEKYMSRVSGDTLFTLLRGCKKGFEFCFLYSPLAPTQDEDYPRDWEEGADYGIVGVDSKFEGHLRSSTYCSASGRIAYSVVEGDGREGERFINVFDYWDQ